MLKIIYDDNIILNMLKEDGLYDKGMEMIVQSAETKRCFALTYQHRLDYPLVVYMYTPNESDSGWITLIAEDETDRDEVLKLTAEFLGQIQSGDYAYPTSKATRH